MFSKEILSSKRQEFAQIEYDLHCASDRLYHATRKMVEIYMNTGDGIALRYANRLHRRAIDVENTIRQIFISKVQG